MKANKKNIKKKNGFTLVEVIVVLVILAIMATILIPSLTGYIDKANERAIIAETRSAVMAAQTLRTEYYALKDSYQDSEVKALAEVKGTISGVTYNGGQVATLVYETDTQKCTYTATDGAYKVEKKP